MNLHNANRLWEMARKRRAAAATQLYEEWPTEPVKSIFFDEPCVQCGSTFRIQTRHTDLVSGQVTYWCDQDWDHWWTALTYLPQIRSGEIDHVSRLFVSTSMEEVEDQLLGWPN